MIAITIVPTETSFIYLRIWWKKEDPENRSTWPCLIPLEFINTGFIKSISEIQKGSIEIETGADLHISWSTQEPILKTMYKEQQDHPEWNRISLWKSK